ncbi:hypothetical protein GGQ10_000641 [Salinibacter ruber]|nr:hypothetical protein [Salinibacter ruber]
MVLVDVAVAAVEDELVRREARLLGQQAGEEGVAGDVERKAEEVYLTTDLGNTRARAAIGQISAIVLCTPMQSVKHSMRDKVLEVILVSALP